MLSLNKIGNLWRRKKIVVQTVEKYCLPNRASSPMTKGRDFDTGGQLKPMCAMEQTVCSAVGCIQRTCSLVS